MNSFSIWWEITELIKVNFVEYKGSVSIVFITI